VEISASGVLAFLCSQFLLCGAGSGFFSKNLADDIAGARKITPFSSIVLDTHDDATQRFFSAKISIGKRTPDWHVIYPRMR